MALRDIETGHSITGIDFQGNPNFCVVTSKQHHGHGLSYGNYTADHYMLHYVANASDGAQNENVLTVVPHGENGTSVQNDTLFNVLTSNCVAITDVAGEHATAFSTVGCDARHWNLPHLVAATKAFQAVVHAIPPAFEPDSHDSSGNPHFWWDETDSVAMRQLCQDLTECALDADNCSTLKQDIDAFTQSYHLAGLSKMLGYGVVYHLVGGIAQEQDDEFLTNAAIMFSLIGFVAVLVCVGLIWKLGKCAKVPNPASQKQASNQEKV